MDIFSLILMPQACVCNVTINQKKSKSKLFVFDICLKKEEKKFYMHGHGQPFVGGGVGV